MAEESSGDAEGVLPRAPLVVFKRGGAPANRLEGRLEVFGEHFLLDDDLIGALGIGADGVGLVSRPKCRRTCR
jgi:hypothetical protein